MSEQNTWFVGEDDSLAGTPFIPIEMPNGMKACEVYGWGDDLEITQEDRERAALIALAVNSHAALVDALRGLVYETTHMSPLESDGPPKQNI